jgi:DNA-binding transcriptional MocR family regulator
LLLAPDPDSAAVVADALRASVQMPVFLMVALVLRWLQDGSADAMIAAIRHEAAARQRLAGDVLARHGYQRHKNGHHIWIPLPRGRSRTEFASHVQRQGLAIVTAESFSVEDNPPDAIRVSLGAASSRSALVSALQILAGALGSSSAGTHVI